MEGAAGATEGGGVIALITAIVLGAANFTWQAFGPMDWNLAIERTWFQGVACFAMWLAEK